MDLLDALKLSDELKQMEDNLRPALITYRNRAIGILADACKTEAPLSAMPNEAGIRAAVVDELLRVIEHPCILQPE